MTKNIVTITEIERYIAAGNYHDETIDDEQVFVTPAGSRSHWPGNQPEYDECRTLSRGGCLHCGSDIVVAEDGYYCLANEEHRAFADEGSSRWVNSHHGTILVNAIGEWI